MNYDVVLKAIGEATDLRKLMDSLQVQITQKDAQLDFTLIEIAKREKLEGAAEKLNAERKEMVSQLERHQAELNKRLAKLKDANVSLPFDESIAPRQVVNT